MGETEHESKPQWRDCCSTLDNQNHKNGCAVMKGINARFERDFSGATFKDSYIEHSATAIRRRALEQNANSNGHRKASIEPAYKPESFDE